MDNNSIQKFNKLVLYTNLVQIPIRDGITLFFFFRVLFVIGVEISHDQDFKKYQMGNG